LAWFGLAWFGFHLKDGPAQSMDNASCSTGTVHRPQEHHNFFAPLSP